MGVPWNELVVVGACWWTLASPGSRWSDSSGPSDIRPPHRLRVQPTSGLASPQVPGISGHLVVGTLQSGQDSGTSPLLHPRATPSASSPSLLSPVLVACLNLYRRFLLSSPSKRRRSANFDCQHRARADSISSATHYTADWACGHPTTSGTSETKSTEPSFALQRLCSFRYLAEMTTTSHYIQ